MGHHARTLLALCALLIISSLAWTAGASALTAKVRVETPSSPSGFIPRTIVTYDATQPVKVSDTVSCPGNTPIGVLNAATGGAWTATPSSTTPDTTQLASIKSSALTGVGQWATYVNMRYTSDPCTTPIDTDQEVLFYPWCNGTRRASCFMGGPLWFRFQGRGFYGTDAVNVGLNIPVTLFGVEALAPNGTGSSGPSVDSTLTTDGGFTARTDNYQLDGTGAVQFPDKGAHSATISEADKVPDRAAVCVSDGADGLCGSVYSPPPDFDPNNYPSACDTNGHDGYCGTADTSGPVATVTNIKQGQSFATKKGPGEVKGSLAPDPNGVGSVNIRIARTYTSRVRIKTKKVKKGKKKPKVRYRTVKHCAIWSDKTALFESAKCTARPKWAEATLDDTRENFSYDFALKLPKGTYKLEVQAKDVPGFTDVVTPGRNVLTFTVK